MLQGCFAQPAVRITVSLGQVPGHSRMVVADFVTSATASHGDETLAHAGFDRVNDLVSHGEDLMVGESAGNLAGFDFDRRRAFRFAAKSVNSVKSVASSALSGT